MKDLNNVTLLGRLTKDAELRYTNGGTAIAAFSIAVNRTRKNGEQYEDEANFFDSILIGRLAEGVHPYLKKGQQVAVSGELHQNRWQTREGENRSRVEIVANHLQLVGGRPGESRQPPAGGNGRGGAPRSQPQQGNADSFEDDVPF